MREIFVLIRLAGCKLGVPLSQIEVLDVKGETREAVDELAVFGWNGLRVLMLFWPLCIVEETG